VPKHGSIVYGEFTAHHERSWKLEPPNMVRYFKFQMNLIRKAACRVQLDPHMSCKSIKKFPSAWGWHLISMNIPVLGGYPVWTVKTDVSGLGSYNPDSNWHQLVEIDKGKNIYI